MVHDQSSRPSPSPLISQKRGVPRGRECKHTRIKFTAPPRRQHPMISTPPIAFVRSSPLGDMIAPEQRVGQFYDVFSHILKRWSSWCYGRNRLRQEFGSLVTFRGVNSTHRHLSDISTTPHTTDQYMASHRDRRVSIHSCGLLHHDA